MRFARVVLLAVRSRRRSSLRHENADCDKGVGRCFAWDSPALVVRKHATAVFEAIRAPIQAPPQSVRNLGFGCFPNRRIPSNRSESKQGVQKTVGSRSQARSIAEIGGRFSVHRVDPSGPDKVGSKSSLLYRLRRSRESFRGLGFSSITRALLVGRLRQHQ